MSRKAASKRSAICYCSSICRSYSSLITLAAFAVALLAPILRDAQNISYARTAFILGVQATGMASYLRSAVRRRRRMLEVCGMRLGVGYCGVFKWRHWPFLKSWMLTLLMTLFQMGMAILLSPAPIHPGMFIYWIYLFQVGVHSGMVFSNLIWKQYPSSFTFYEHGLVAPSRSYMTWDKSPLSGRARFIKIVSSSSYIPMRKGCLGDTKVVQAPRKLREQVQQLATQYSCHEPSEGR